jgi:DNA-binding response OmpR family regulator
MSAVKVLIVDDEHDFATALAERLRLRGYEATAIFSPDEALATTKEMQPDVVLLDLKLPGVSGIEMLMTMREFVPGVEIILLTGHLDLAQRIQGMRLDAFEYIMKPIEIADLINKIEKVGKHRDRT